MSSSIPLSSNPKSRSPDQFLVCGLGSLGEHCVAILREFGGLVCAIDQHPPERWELPHLPDCLHQLEVGDCRHPEILKKAGIEQCRSVLIVTSNERVNIETAFAARLLNPKVRLVVRSAKQNLNDLLQQQLGNFVAFEPTQLSAPAFALAALEQEILGFFNLNDQLFEVMQYQIQPGDRWCDVRRVYELNSSSRRVLAHIPVAAQLPGNLFHPHRMERFYHWEPDARVQAGDTLITVEAVGVSQRSRLAETSATEEPNHSPWQRIGRSLTPTRLKRGLMKLWQNSRQNRIQRVALICGFTVFLLVISGTLLFSLYYPNIDVLDAFYATFVLLLGGYGDLFSEFPLAIAIPWWLRLFGLGLTLAGTAFVGVLYALLTEKLLTLRLQFLQRRPPIPQRNHIVVIGLGRVGRRVAHLLQDLQKPVVGIASDNLDPDTLPQLPLLTGNIANALSKANLNQASSIIAVTEEEMQNLELGLMAHGANPDCSLVIRTYDYRFSSHVAQLFPYAHVLCVSALSADAFAAAAYGENVLSLFRLNDRTILVTEYLIEDHDTLNGHLLSEIAYGYRVVPIAHQKATKQSFKFMPSDDNRLQVGDRLIVLATTENLQRVERGDMSPRCWQIVVERAMNRSATFDGASEIACISGCDLSLARSLMENLPGVLPIPLYKHQALRLTRKLNRMQVIAHTEPVANSAH